MHRAGWFNMSLLAWQLQTFHLFIQACTYRLFNVPFIFSSIKKKSPLGGGQWQGLMPISSDQIPCGSIVFRARVHCSVVCSTVFSANQRRPCKSCIPPPSNREVQMEI